MRTLALVLVLALAAGAIATWLASRAKDAKHEGFPPVAAPIAPAEELPVDGAGAVGRDLDSAQLAFERALAVEPAPGAHGTPGTPVDFTAALLVRVRGADGAPVPHAELRVLTAARTRVADARADDAGRARVAVPAGTPLIVAAREGADATKASDDEARAAVALDLEPLAAGEERELALDLVGYALVHVKVIDQRGAPVASQPLGVARSLGLPDLGAPTTLLAANAMPEVRHQTITDADGRCVVGPVRAGAGWIVLVPLRKPWQPASASAVAPIAQRFVVPEHCARVDVRIVASRDVYVRGRVEVEDGELFPPGAGPDATPNVVLVATRAAGDGTTGQPERDGTFAIGPLVDDEYEITTFGRYVPADSTEPIRVRPGGPPFVIRMVRGGRVAARAIDPATRAGVACEFALTKQGTQSLATYGSGGEDGAIGADGLAPGEYALAAWSSDGRVGVASGVRVDAKGVTEGVEVALCPRAECGELRVAVRDASDVQAWDATGCRVVAYVKPGAARSLVVPAGAIEVRLVSNGRVLEQRSFKIAAGEVADVAFDR